MKSLIIVFSILLGGLAHAQGSHNHNNSPVTYLNFAKGNMSAHVAWEVGPQVSKESLLKIEWKDGSDHSPAEPSGLFEVVLWMSSMNHGSAPTQLEPVLDAQGQPLVGVYRVTNIYFIMGGEWQVHLILTYPDGTKETQTINVVLPDGGGHH